jgi:hypothetical protein
MAGRKLLLRAKAENKKLKRQHKLSDAKLLLAGKARKVQILIQGGIRYEPGNIYGDPDNVQVL